MLHFNITSLSKHIGELQSFIKVLEYLFDVIGITETRLIDTNPLQPSELRSAFGNANLNADFYPQKVSIFLPTMYRWMVNVKS